MKQILLIAVCLVSIVGTVSAYGLYLDCPQSVQAGLPLKCSIDSDLPAGNTFDLVMYRSQYTATELSRQSVTIQENKNTQYRLFDTTGLPGGMYKIEIQFKGPRGEEDLRSDSVTTQIVQIIDRSSEITITSPITQTPEEALRIEGDIYKKGNEGVQIEVRGPDGRIFGPQYIGTETDVRNDAGMFRYRVPVISPGMYDVIFTDPKGYIGTKTFTVAEPPTTVMTTIPTTIPATTLTTVPTTLPTTTQSPLPLPLILGAVVAAGLLAAATVRRR